MEVIEKKIVRLGNSSGIIIDTRMSFGSNIKLGDTVTIKCQKNKLIITKKEKGE